MPGILTGPLTGFIERQKGKGFVELSALQRMGKSAAAMAGGGNLSVQSSAAGVGNGADTTEDVLFTATLPANILDVVGRQIILEAFGAIAATSANKTVEIFGSSIVYTAVVATTTATGDWQAQLIITKVGSNTQIAIGTVDFAGATTVRGVTKSLAGTESDTAAITVKVTGTSSVATANLVTCNQFAISGYN